MSGVERRARISGFINLLFFLVAKRVDDFILVVAYRRLIEIEPDQELRFDLMIQEAANNYQGEYVYILAKISALDSLVLEEG